MPENDFTPHQLAVTDVLKDLVAQIADNIQVHHILIFGKPDSVDTRISSNYGDKKEIATILRIIADDLESMSDSNADNAV